MIFTQEGKGVCKHFFGLFFSLKNYDSHLKSKHKTHSNTSVASGCSVCPTKPECIKLDMWPRTGEHSNNILLSKQLQKISSISLLRRQLRSTASKYQTQHLTVIRWLSISGDMKNWNIDAKMKLYISVQASTADFVRPTSPSMSARKQKASSKVRKYGRQSHNFRTFLIRGIWLDA